ncbi:hypothetical protein FV230_19925 [Methylobacterium sp. WL6]|nr:hypothetical protein FV230_19925 [Methylobacterium sp. WL6]
MPSLRLSNPFRRGAERPSLKERAAALRETADRVMRRPAVGDDLGGHASVATTGRYLHARPSESSARFLGV